MRTALRFLVLHFLVRVRGTGLTGALATVLAATGLCLWLMATRPAAFPSSGPGLADGFARALRHFLLPVQAAALTVAGTLAVLGERARRAGTGATLLFRAAPQGGGPLSVGDALASLAVFLVLSGVCLAPHAWAGDLGAASEGGVGEAGRVLVGAAFGGTAAVEVAARMAGSFGGGLRVALLLEGALWVAAAAAGVWQP